MFDKDLCAITCVPQYTFDRLKTSVNYVHANEAITQILDNQQVIRLDTFEGNIYIKRVDDDLQYKFVPSEEFEKAMINCFVNNKNPLEVTAVTKLKEILTHVYKDLF